MRVAQMARAIGRGLFQSFADTAPEIRAIMISAAQMQSVPGAVPDETLASPRCAAEPLPEAVLNEVTASQVSGGPSPKSKCKCDACGRAFKSKRKAPDMDKSITSGGKPSKPKTTPMLTDRTECASSSVAAYPSDVDSHMVSTYRCYRARDVGIETVEAKRGRVSMAMDGVTLAPSAAPIYMTDM